MRKSTKIWLVTAVSLIIVGLIMFAAVLKAYNWDFTKLQTNKYKTDTYEINEKFNNISITARTEDIVFALSDDNKCKVVCYGQENVKYSANVINDTLTIATAGNKKWYNYISINLHSPKITIYLPKAEYSLLSINSGTGDIDIKNITANTINLSVSTGDVTVCDVMCKNFTSHGSTGDVLLKNLNAEEKIFIKSSTGDIKFDKSDAAEISVKTSTGDVTGTLLTEKIFTTKTSTGSVKMPKTTTGGKCDITTSTGDININIVN